jgi:hypothetical protein
MAAMAELERAVILERVTADLGYGEAHGTKSGTPICRPPVVFRRPNCRASTPRRQLAGDRSQIGCRNWERGERCKTARNWERGERCKTASTDCLHFDRKGGRPVNPPRRSTADDVRGAYTQLPLTHNNRPC